MGAPTTLLSDSGNRKKGEKLDSEENFVKLSEKEEDSHRIFYKAHNKQRKKIINKYFLSQVKKNISN